MSDRRQWFAIRVKPRQESLAAANLERQGFRVYLPMMNTRISHAGKVSWQPRPFFVGYLFVHLARDEQRWTTIRSTVGVLAPVVFGTFYPPLNDQVIALLQARHDEDGLISFSSTPEAPFKAGEKVRMLDGSLKGLEGVFIEMRGQDRALILLDWMKKSMRVVADTSVLASDTR
ncbi:MAG: transcriptional activator RfaH [Zetaproteobacteria bacterium CG12_big_fil_rev_8_21_14_0_65_54_13]|nr:MAG: transcriptional activator RfaH [Zetaproteobacteria bacterium CG12_big_fil_rev_8_21_14_0_65_54_13]PIX55858.1 MAG: transcriptional activator RfaH [Zetaproteobacteria bacterium CG_4_10_14_3_um_filter_54_28]PJA30676.1 MAG: transcriptional activator RfaH [Zetaproteobacteria bacterium CG_4_9_14_3_um_filter_54_145]